MSARDEIIQKANDLTRYEADCRVRLAAIEADVAELRELCPWAFNEDGAPLPEKQQRRGGRLD